MTTTHQKIQFFDQKGCLLPDLTIECTTNGAHMDYLSEVKRIFRRHDIVRYLHDNSKAKGQELIHSIHFYANPPHEALVEISSLADMATSDEENYRQSLAIDTTRDNRQFVTTVPTVC